MVVAAVVTLAVSQVTIQITSGATRIDQRCQIQTEAAIAMTRMRSELGQAIAIVSLSASQVTFTHPDVTGDGVADTVTYQWSGTAGDSVTRQVNGGAQEDMLTQCQAFSLSALAPTVHLVAGTRYPLKLLYYQKTGTASCHLMWSAAGVTKQIIPQTRLFPAFVEPTAPAPGANGTGLTGQYYDNSDLTALTMTRTDATVDWDWGSGSPGGGIASGTFSIRWTGQLKPSVTGDYTFYVNSDDGVRLWVNNSLVIDNWTDHTAASESAGVSTGVSRIDISLEAGPLGNTAHLDGSVRCLNLPCKGS